VTIERLANQNRTFYPSYCAKLSKQVSRSERCNSYTRVQQKLMTLAAYKFIIATHKSLRYHNALGVSTERLE